MQTTLENNNITQGTIWKQLLFFFFPILFGTFFQQLYNTADAIIVGNIAGKQALAAVGGSTATLINLLVGFFVGLSSGATVIISQFFGAKDVAKIRKGIHTAIALALVGGLTLMILGIFIGPYALQKINTPVDILPLAIDYLQIYFLGTIPSLLYNLGSGILRAMGDSKRPLYFLIVACLTNIGLDIVFVGGMGMGIKGAAWATIVSQLVSALLILYTLTQQGTIYQVRFSEIGIDKEMLVSIIKIGLPAGLQSVMYSFSNILIQSSINSFGTDVVAAWTAYSKIDSIFWMTLGSFGISITTFVGQNYGAKQYIRVKQGVSICLKMTFSVTIVLAAFLYFFGKWVCYLFTKDPTVIEYGQHILQTLTPWYITYVCVEILSGALRGAGEVVVPTFICCFGICVMRMLWLWVAVPIVPKLETVLASYPITWSISSIAFIIYYYKSGWMQRRIANSAKVSSNP